jgi:hypothetical protein
MTNSNFTQPETRRKISLRSKCFTPCKHQVSLLEPFSDAAENAARHATILLSPARSSHDGFQNARITGEKIYRKVKSISWGHRRESPNRNGQMTAKSEQQMGSTGTREFSIRAFLRKKHESNHSLNSTSLQKGRHQRQRQ